MSYCGDELLLWRVAAVAQLLMWRTVCVDVRRIVGMKRRKDAMKSGISGTRID